MKKEYYVYIDYRLDTMTACYVGMGKGVRFRTASRNNHHDCIMNKYGIARVKIYENLTQDRAFLLEKCLISHFVFTMGYGIDIEGYRCNAQPYLTNQTWGGKTTEGYKHTQEGHVKMRGKHSGDKNFNVKKVVCFTLGYKKIYTTIKEGGETEGISPSNVNVCCQGKIPYCGYHNNLPLIWCYESDYKQLTQNKKYHLLVNAIKKARTIYCISTHKVFINSTQARQEYNLPPMSDIGRCCRGQRKFAGVYNNEKLQWCYYHTILEND